MPRRASRLFILSALLCGVLLVGAASASAATLYVSSASPAGPGGKSCVEPNFNTIQGAINANGSTINVCPGTYTEQLNITKGVKLVAIGGAGTATVAMPAGAVDSPSTCDSMIGEQKDEISICTSGTVSITGLNVQAIIPTTSCLGSLNGIFVAGGGTLKAANLAINGASTNVPGLKGCQYGIAVEVGSKTPAEVGHAVLTKATITGYQKNGPTVKGAGSSLTMTASTVTGEGPSPTIAQNGVEVAFGAAGKITSTTVSGNECELSGVCTSTSLEEQATGVLFFEAATSSKVTSSTLKENDIGAYYASNSATVPSGPGLTLTKDVFNGNRYEGVLLEEGKASLTGDKITGPGRVGIDLFQSAKQKSAIDSAATKTKISGQSEASIKVESDKQPGDIPGKFTFTKGTAAAPVLINESNNFEVIF